MQVITEQTRRFRFEHEGEFVEASHTEGADSVALSYAGVSGNASVVLPIESLDTAIELLTAIRSHLSPEPEEG